ncbi:MULTISPECIES: dTDP-4-dehydrorhamnose 3,5-epimerase [Bartonella]|uniref:dTDP-4-dehydrorhamnose 3,5-epimerase n=1 Tax=Bartonella TaxID=773 RepID=UPI0018DE1A49|nr:MULTISPECIES: dTDP-4-dehydrorhamnose 3,5-epimerase [Bartonella]MBH9995379.1 dTDP-4-dehydrorhamnose 3,5-epimerase [Bartonella sp. P0291]MBH9996277.1 dTDP-4-dehydrorhamnose 3,5-epimerase [Bartonella sp. M0192]MBH9998438.1 dTDP-4-dehydrorhamnose 3,5-epimerase [Bartonella sp. M0191]MBI0007734.1 dTDP-4-dehydrorhamnose 3,5-epimerase [Bartonella sp. M0193]MBI0009728.1 dTDP-4-dehydrorhamnose 3,5-epimerase [Bartonella sp. M0176]
MIEVNKTPISDVFIIQPKKFGDNRGFFSETYNAKDFSAHGINDIFVQDNQSYSAKAGTLRGLHYQLTPHAQTKLVRVTRGRVFDVAVDIRRGSSTFLKWTSVELSPDKWNEFYIPAGFAHGFLTLEDNCEFVYKVTDYYAPECDRSIRFDDPDIAIKWPIDLAHVELSEKDKNAPFLKDAELFDFAEMTK